jgi:hypothetical protein
VQLLGNRAMDAAKTTLRLVAQAAWGLMGPDGDVAYHGRSQEQGWTLGLTANGVEAAVALAGASAALYHPIGQRALVRLRDVHGTGPKGLYLTPSLREDMRDHLHGVDTYAGVVGYSGLTLVGCNWATDLRDDEAAPAADGGGTFGYEYALDPFKTGLRSRRDGLWFAVRAAPRPRPMTCATTSACGAEDAGSAPAAGSMRCGRARTPAPAPTAPLVLPSASGSAGRELDIAADGTVTVTGGFRTVAGEWPRRGVHFRYQPHEGGVRLIFPPRPATGSSTRCPSWPRSTSTHRGHAVGGGRPAARHLLADAEVAFDAAGAVRARRRPGAGQPALWGQRRRRGAHRGRRHEHLVRPRAGDGRALA